MEEQLLTDFPERTVEPGETVNLTSQNVIEFVIPPAPDYVSEDVLLKDSAYPYLFGGVFLVSNDYSAAIRIPLS
jgi:hypothetical protein